MPTALVPMSRATPPDGPRRWTRLAEPETVSGLRQVLVDHAVALGADDELGARVALAVSEAVTNVVVHAYRHADEPGVVEAEAEQRDGTLEIRIRDHGLGFLPRSDSPGLGLGLPLMAKTADVMDVGAPPGGGVEVRLVFALRAPAGLAAAA